jgi:uncharacterized protein YndB with AHSA1/START domain/DNA-binding transcriptional ArsR family regulator
MQQDIVFKALADENRRTLLDLLMERDGQTLTELCDHLDMTRFGVMKHLQVLEEAGLVTTQKVGRSKHHYLNAVPIQTVYDRWVSKYAQPWAQALSTLKTTLESETMTAKPDRIFQTYIRTTPDRLWQALTDGTFTRQYYMASIVESDWTEGADYRYLTPDGHPLIQGQVIECDPPTRLVTTFNAMWLPEGERGPASTVTFNVEPMGDVCKLTVTHADLPPEMAEGINDGWAQILAGLKTLLETGKPLNIDG